MEPLNVAAFSREVSERVSVNFATKIDSVINILVAQNIEMARKLNGMEKALVDFNNREKKYRESLIQYLDSIKNFY